MALRILQLRPISAEWRTKMKKITGVIALAAALGASAGALAQDTAPKPTIVLVHGAFADSSGWNDVITILEMDGYRTIAAPNQLRAVASDAANVSAVVKSIVGLVVLVGHSFGGMVITEAANGNENVKALVYVAAFMPDTGDSANSLLAKFPGTMINSVVAPVPLADGGVDLYIRPDLFHDVFAADIPEKRTHLMAVTQRPVTLADADEAARDPAWKDLPSYVIYGVEDRIIPAALVRFMADRAHAVEAVGIKGAPHALMVSRPREVASMIEKAAASIARVN
jgi:pimeloyl-ACP methyl ester carboxylesterase